jgi:3-phenylpropionate/trans-cinnamate dioxygenase ferredoxin reductase subunit
MTEQFVIVGGGLAGAKAVETLRAEGFGGSVVLIAAEADRPYERPPLSKGYLLGKDPRDNAFVHPSAWYGEQGIDLRTGTRVVRLQPGAHEVELNTGERLPYTKLLLATGSYPRKLDVEGANLTGVTYLRRLGDSDRLRSALTEGANVVVIGAGWIGLEVAAAARSHGADPTVVETERLPLRRVLGDEVARTFAHLHRANGVTFHFGSGVRRIVGDDSGAVRGVELVDGTELPADVVVVGVGIRPAVELAEVAGLEVDNGVVTDQSLRTSDPDVFACGDVASSHNPLVGKRIRVEHWSNALNGGKAAAKAMLGQAVVYDRVPYFYTDQFDLGMEYSGFVEPGGYDSVVFRGDPSLVDGKAPECIAFWLAGDRVLAGMNVNIWDVTDQIQALVRAGYAGRGVDVGALADPSVPLDDLLT